MQKVSQMASSTSLASLSMAVSPSPDEVKKISTPKVKMVTRKRPCYSIEEKEKRKKDEKKMRLMKEEDKFYLRINTENLQMMKDHLEKVKLKMKEMKEKKKIKKKTWSCKEYIGLVYYDGYKCLFDYPFFWYLIANMSDLEVVDCDDY